MYPGAHAKTQPDTSAFIMASTGETVTCGELESRTNQLARYFRSVGLHRNEHYSIIMQNNARYLESCGAGDLSGLYYTCINSYLTPEELAYILTNSLSRVLITSQTERKVALKAMAMAPGVERCLVVDGPGEGGGTDCLLPATSGWTEVPALRGLRGRVTARADGQALQAGAARSLLA